MVFVAQGEFKGITFRSIIGEARAWPVSVLSKALFNWLILQVLPSIYIDVGDADDLTANAEARADSRAIRAAPHK